MGSNRTERKGTEGEGDCTASCGASIKYFSRRLSRHENAFDPDSKGLLQNKHFFELAAALWDSRGGVALSKGRRSLSEIPPSVKLYSDIFALNFTFFYFSLNQSGK